MNIIPENIMETDENVIQTALAAGAATNPIHTVLAPDGIKIPFVVVPVGYNAIFPGEDEFAPFLASPLRTKGTFAFSDTDSFIRYFNEHKNEHSRIFANITDKNARFQGVINFHAPDQPQFRDHVCVTSTVPTHEWLVWTDRNRKCMTQGEFATFLEENSDMFVDPSGTTLLELVQTLEGKADVNIKQAVKLQNGGLQINYSEDIELRGGASSAQDGTMLLPTILTVGIAPFEGVSRYEMKARLRYRIENRKITFWYEAINPHLFVRAIVADILKTITSQTGVEPFKT